MWHPRDPTEHPRDPTERPRATQCHPWGPQGEPPRDPQTPPCQGSPTEGRHGRGSHHSETWGCPRMRVSQGGGWVSLGGCPGVGVSLGTSQGECWGGTGGSAAGRVARGCHSRVALGGQQGTHLVQPPDLGDVGDAVRSLLVIVGDHLGLGWEETPKPGKGDTELWHWGSPTEGDWGDLPEGGSGPSVPPQCVPRGPQHRRGPRPSPPRGSPR